ncbi:MAG: circadian clock protein KaiC [Aquabacterium sp.]
MKLEKLPTGIPGVDLIAEGGIPKGRTTLVAGSAGSAKTVFAAQFLAEGIRGGANGVFVTFEESARDIRANAASLQWDIPGWEREAKWAFVDASPHPDQSIIAGNYDLGALMARVEHAIAKVGAKRIAMDSIGAAFTQFPDASVVRREMFRLSERLKDLGVTTVITAERTEGGTEISRFGVEEFVADNVIVLRNSLEEQRRRRTIEILKFRGATHQKGEFPFTVRPAEGMVVIPPSALELTEKSSDHRVTSGLPELDALCGGGFFQNSIVLVSGATGSGKTLIASQFMAGFTHPDERSLLLAFEESRDQLFRNARAWGLDFASLERQGRLKVICVYPEAQGLEDHLIAIKHAITDFNPNRIAVDSLTALERSCRV